MRLKVDAPYDDDSTPDRCKPYDTDVDSMFMMVPLAVDAYTMSEFDPNDNDVDSILVRTQNLKVLPLKPGVGQYIAIHATLTARNFFFAYFYPSSPFTCIFFSKTSPDYFFPALAVANTGSCVGPQNKIVHPTGCRFPC